jgi:peptidoglycan/LPS O-acetylase OafA/YrhL
MEVFLGHLRTLLFKNYWDGPDGTGKKIFYFFTGFSHEAVIVFFVLSGFFITGAIIKAIENRRFSFLNYGLDRLVRLWIVLLPGLVFTFLVDRIGLHYFGNNLAYTGSLKYMGHIDVSANLNFKTFVGNVFFLQNILVNTFGSNAPLWSLCNEFWYYFLFPVTLFIFISKKNWQRFLFLGMALGIIIFIGENISLYFLIWLIGSVVFFIGTTLPPPSIRIRNILFSGGLIVFFICLYKLRTGGRSDFMKDFISGIVTGIVCYTGLFSNIRSRIINRVASFFSGISYSLYVLHLPLCILITSCLAGFQRDWGLNNFILYIIIVFFVLGVTVGFWYLFESRYIQVRTYLKRKFFSSIQSATIKN